MHPSHPLPTLAESGKTAARERGCFQCSRRRIICDKSEPTCNKCTKKGIECSGLGRVRFTGAANRGRLKCKVDGLDERGTEASGFGPMPSSVTFKRLRWKDDESKTGTPCKKRKLAAKKSEEAERAIRVPANTAVPESEQQLESFQIEPHGPRPFPCYVVEEQDCKKVVQDTRENGHHIARPHTSSQHIYPWIAPMSSKVRMLFTHFSEAVAPVMVVQDTAGNGYRELILPMALEDEVLRRAVGVVAAQHLCGVNGAGPDLIRAAEAGRNAVISRLRRDALCGRMNEVFNEFTWATLIVLLVGETVIGSPDYSFLVRMLLCLSKNYRVKEKSSNVVKFLQAQTNMFELLGMPLLGEDGSALNVLNSFESTTGWLSCENLPLNTEGRRITDSIRQCFATACTIYIRSATADINRNTAPAIPDDSTQESIIDGLICLMSTIPSTASGAHALVWVCFLAAAEATSPDQRAFFTNYMKGIYARTKFRNIPAAIQSLEKIWKRNNGKRWTQCLPELSKVLVM